MKEHIGRYRIGKKLGEGGMGSVHLGYDPMLDRQVAIKVMSPALANDHTFVQRFLLEARAVARMEHPNIVAVYDADNIDGLYYLVMEFVSGGSLEDLIQQKGRLSFAQIANIIEQVASGLDYAHSHQMVHRDIKPNNILFDTDGQAHVTDFGLVKTEEVVLTQAGQIFGTPAYMAPEQIEGQPVGPYTDVYALGIVAYRMLAERLPFDGSMATIFDGHVRRPPPPFHQLNANIPAPIQAAVFQAMGKQHNRRFKSAGAFAKALRYAIEASSSDHIATEISSQPNIYHSNPSYQPPQDTPSRWKSSTNDKRVEARQKSQPTPFNPSYNNEPAAREPVRPTARLSEKAKTTPTPRQQPNPVKTAQPQAKINSNQAKGTSKWGKRLLILAGMFFLSLCICASLIFVVAIAGESNTRAGRDTPNAPIVTIPAENAAPNNTNPGFRRITDDSGRLEVQVPLEWGDTDSGNWEFNNQKVGRYLIGTTNLEQALNSWQAPGIYLAVSKPLVTQYTTQQLLEGNASYGEECLLVEQDTYNDGFYTGHYNLWNTCGNENAAIMTIVATPPDKSYVILVKFQMTTEKDSQVVDQILQSIMIRP